MDKTITLDKKNKLTDWLLIFFGGLIFSYTFTRACLLSITWDESQSYLEYIKNNCVLLDEYDYMSANNHIFNTLFGIFFTKIFGVSEFVLRIPTLISHIIFLVYSAKFVSTFKNNWLVVSAFLLLNLNPYLLDFFSLARGYGMSIAFMMVSVFYLYQFCASTQKNKYAILAIFFAVLASIANLVLLNYAIVLYGMIILLFLKHNFQSHNSFSKAIKPTFIQLLLPTAIFTAFLYFILPIAFGLKNAGSLFMGGDQGIWKDTIGTVVNRIFYDHDFNYWSQRLVKILVFVVLTAAAVFVGFKMYKKQSTAAHQFLAVLILLLSLIVLSTSIQYHALGTYYLLERAALFLVVLFNLLFVFFINELTKENNKAQFILIISSVLVVVHFSVCFNLKYVYDWKEDCETREMLVDLEKIKEKDPHKFNVMLAVPLAFESSVNYYRYVNHLDWLNQTTRFKKINYLADYFYLTLEEYWKVNFDSMEVVKMYPITKSVLGRAKYHYQSTDIVFDTIMNFEPDFAESFYMDSDTIFSPYLKYTLNDSVAPIKHSMFSFKAKVMLYVKKAAPLYIVFAYKDKNKKSVWFRARMNDVLKEEDDDWQEVSYSAFIPDKVRDGDELKAYIWNPNGRKIFIKEMQLRLFSKK